MSRGNKMDEERYSYSPQTVTVSPYSPQTVTVSPYNSQRQDIMEGDGNSQHPNYMDFDGNGSQENPNIMEVDVNSQDRKESGAWINFPQDASIQSAKAMDAKEKKKLSWHDLDLDLDFSPFSDNSPFSDYSQSENENFPIASIKETCKYFNKRDPNVKCDDRRSSSNLISNTGGGSVVLLEGRQLDDICYLFTDKTGQVKTNFLTNFSNIDTLFKKDIENLRELINIDLIILNQKLMVRKSLDPSEVKFISGLSLVESQTLTSFILPAKTIYELSNIISYKLYKEALEKERMGLAKAEAVNYQSLVIPDNPIEGFLHLLNRCDRFSNNIDNADIDDDVGPGLGPGGGGGGGNGGGGGPDLDDESFLNEELTVLQNYNFNEANTFYSNPNNLTTIMIDYRLQSLLKQVKDVNPIYIFTKISKIKAEVDKELKKDKGPNISNLYGLLYELAICYQVQNDSINQDDYIISDSINLDDNNKRNLANLDLKETVSKRQKINNEKTPGKSDSDIGNVFSFEGGEKSAFNFEAIKDYLDVYEDLCLKAPILMFYISIKEWSDDNSVQELFHSLVVDDVIGNQIFDEIIYIQTYLKNLIEPQSSKEQDHKVFFASVEKYESIIIDRFSKEEIITEKTGGGSNDTGMIGGARTSIIPEKAYVNISGYETEHDLSPKTQRIKDILQKIKNNSIYNDLFETIRLWYNSNDENHSFSEETGYDDNLYNIINKPFSGETEFLVSVWEYLLLKHPERFNIVYAADRTFVFRDHKTILSDDAINALREGEETDEYVKDMVIKKCRNQLLKDIYTKYGKEIPLLFNPKDNKDVFHATVMEPNPTIMGSKGGNYLSIAEDMVFSKQTCTGFNSMGLIKVEYDKLNISEHDIDDLTTLFFPEGNSYVLEQVEVMTEAAKKMPKLVMYATIFDPAFTGNDAPLENGKLKQSDQLIKMYGNNDNIVNIKKQLNAFIYVADISATNRCLNLFIDNTRIIISSKLLYHGNPVGDDSTNLMIAFDANDVVDGIKYYYNDTDTGENVEAFTISIGDFAVSSVVETIVFLKTLLDTNGINLNEDFNDVVLDTIIESCTSDKYIRLYRYAQFVITHTDFRFGRTWQAFFVIIVYAKTTGDRKQRETADIINTFIRYRNEEPEDAHFDTYAVDAGGAGGGLAAGGALAAGELKDIMTILYPANPTDPANIGKLIEINNLLKPFGLYSSDQIMVAAAACSKTIILNSLKPSFDLTHETEAFMDLWEEDMKKYMGSTTSSAGGLFISDGNSLYVVDEEEQKKLKISEIKNLLKLVFYKLYLEEWSKYGFDEGQYITYCLTQVIVTGGLPVFSLDMNVETDHSDADVNNTRLEKTDVKELDKFVQTLRLLMNYMKYVALDTPEISTTMNNLIDLEILTNIASITDPEQKRLIGFLGKITSSNIPSLITTNATNKALVDALLSSRIKATNSVKKMIVSQMQYFTNLKTALTNNSQTNPYLTFIDDKNIGKIIGDLTNANTYITQKQTEVMNTILTDLQNSIKVAATQESYKANKPDRMAAVNAKANIMSVSNDSIVKISDEIVQLKTDLNAQIKERVKLARELAISNDEISNKKANIVIFKQELKNAPSNAASNAGFAGFGAVLGANKKKAKDTEMINTKKDIREKIIQEEEDLKKAIKNQKKIIKDEKDNIKKSEGLKLSLDAKAKLEKMTIAKNAFFASCSKKCEDLQKGFDDIKRFFSISFSGGSKNKSSKTKKHYRKKYNTKKKQVRHFIKKTKMKRKRFSRQSRRRH